jgi:DsbC/DsbD-like thiol-disulfide interchange protein
MTSARPPIRPLFFLLLSSVLVTSVARADGATHEIRKTEPKVAVGAPGHASLTIAAKNGWHVNAEAPITVSLSSADAALTVAKPKLSRADLAESTQVTARFDIPVTAAAGTAAGKKTINAEARFVMCQESACKPVKETLALNVEVTAAADPTAVKGKGAGKGKTKTK